MSLSKDKLLIGWGKPQRLSAREMHPQKPAFYFSDFFLTLSQPWIQYSDWIEILREDFNQQLAPITELSECHWEIDDPEKFKQTFQELQQLLQTGELEKGVPYLFAHSSYRMNIQRLQLCLKQAVAALEQQKGYLYGHWHLSSGVLGLTPELLFSHSKKQSQKLFTMALAGTYPLSDCSPSFLKNEKEYYEHQLVVKGIYQSLQPLGKVHIGNIQLLQLPNLAHLMTPIEVDLMHSFDFDLLVRSLHPTPALGALPIENGRKWLQNFQKHTPRHYYGAPIGLRHSQAGFSQCLVGIRNVQWDKLGMRIGAGCGVVRQSAFDKEWQEIQLKIQATRGQLHL